MNANYWARIIVISVLAGVALAVIGIHASTWQHWVGMAPTLLAIFWR